MAGSGPTTHHFGAGGATGATGSLTAGLAAADLPFALLLPGAGLAGSLPAGAAEVTGAAPEVGRSPPSQPLISVRSASDN